MTPKEGDKMRTTETKGILRRVFNSALLIALGLIVCACGGGRSPVGRDVPVSPDGRGKQSPPYSGALGEPKQATLVSLLEELTGLQPPPSVDKDVFTQIKEELAKRLSAKGVKKFTSTPPTSEANAVDDLALNSDGTYTLTWSYKNLGDYNQDGIVDIADITPLAEKFFQSASPENEWIDGNRDGIIDIADITTLAENFFNEVAGYLIQGSNDGVNFIDIETVSFSSASGTGRKKFTYQLSSLTYTRYRIVPIDGQGNRGIASNVTLPPGLFPEEFSQDSGRPGEWIELTGAGWNENTAGLRLIFGDTPVPLAEQVEGVVGFYVPPLEPREYTVILASERYKSDPLSFTILPPESLPFTQTEFADTMESGLTEIVNTTRAAVLRIDAFNDIGYTPEQTQALLTVLGEAQKIISAACGEIDAMNADEAERIQSLCYESGLLSQLTDIANKQPSKLVSQYQELHGVLFACDITSMVITNLQPILEIAKMLSTAVSVASGGAATPSLLFSLSVDVALTVIDGIIDVFIPSDLQSIRLRDRTFRPGQSVPIGAVGYFSCQENFREGAITLTIDVIVSIALEAIDPPPPATVKDSIVASVASWLQDRQIDIITDYLGTVFAGSNDKPLFQNIPVALDLRLYEGGLLSFLAFAFPERDFTALYEQMTSWGIPRILDPVVADTTDHSVAVYNEYSGRIEGIAQGQTQIQAWGLRFEDRDFFFDILTLAIPYGILSNVATITIDPNATTEPPNILSVSPTFGYEGDQVTFTAEVTGTPPISYLWDFRGGASPETSTLESPMVTLTTMRKYTCILTAENEFGSDEYRFILTVGKIGTDPHFRIIPLDGRQLYLPPILLMAGGNPAVIYYGWGSEIRFVRAKDSVGSEWNEPQVIASLSSAASYVFSADLLSDGCPALVFDQYYYSGEPPIPVSLMYMRATSPDGSSWTSPVPITSQSEDCSYGDFAVVAGNPAVIYGEFRVGEPALIKFRRANDPLGDDWGSPVTIGTINDYGITLNNSLAIHSGKPCFLSYYEYHKKFFVTQANDANGSSWGTSVLAVDHDPDELSVYVYSLPLLMIKDVAMFTYTTQPDGTSDYQLRFVRATDSTCSAFEPPVILDASSDYLVSSPAEVGGRPAIAYRWWSRTQLRGEVRLLWADDAGGRAWTAPIIVNGDTPAYELCLGEVNGYPAIAYFNEATGYLDYAYYTP